MIKDYGFTIEPGKMIESGISGGSVLAMILSWHANHSIFWAFVHGICSWFYVIYFWAWNLY